MTKPKRLTKKVKLGSADLYLEPEHIDEKYNTLGEVIDRVKSLYDNNSPYVKGELTKIITKYKDKYNSIYFRIRIEGSDDPNGYCYSCDAYLYDCTCDGTVTVEVWGSRPETDKEYDYRLKREAMAEAKMKKLVDSKNKKDLKEYERLKKKFG